MAVHSTDALRIASRVAARASRVVDSDMRAAAGAVGSMVKRLQKMAETINPQDAARGPVEDSVQRLQEVLSDLDSVMRSLNRTQV